MMSTKHIKLWGDKKITQKIIHDYSSKEYIQVYIDYLIE